MAMFQQMMSSGGLCVILNGRWIMKSLLCGLYLPVLIVYAGLVTLWSDRPEKHGGWLLAIKAEAAASVASLEEHQ